MFLFFMMAQTGASAESFPVQLTHGSLTLFRISLESPGWARGLGDIFAGGKLLASLPEPPPQPEKAIDAWGKLGCYSVTLTDAERLAAKRCLNWHAAAGNLGTGPHVLSLLGELGIAPE